VGKWTDQPARRPDAAADLVSAIDRYATARAQRIEKRRRGRVYYRLRRQLAPWYAAALLVGVAGLATVVGWTGAHQAVETLTTLASIASGVVGAVVVAKRVPAYWRPRAAIAVAAGALWLPWAAEELTWGKLAPMVVGFMAIKARHERSARLPEPTAPPDTREGSVELVELWDAYVGADGYCLPGSILEDGRVERHGDARTEVYPGLVRRGRQTVDHARAALPLIASGLRVPAKNLMLEEHPTDPDPARFVLKRIVASPIESTVHYPGPLWENGRAMMGPYGDGIGMAPYTVYASKRARNGMVIGAPGSGKSRIVDVVCLAPRAQGHTSLIYFDGQDGMSSPALAREAWAFASLDAADLGLAALEEVQRYRQRYMRSLGRNGFAPSPEFPGILIPQDEVHKIYRLDNAERWANLAREFGKVGMAFVVSDQDATLETFRRGVLRDALQTGNTVGLRTANRDAGQILHEGKFNLRDLPGIPGYAYTIDTGTVGCRTAPFRAFLLPDEDDREQGRVPATVPTVDEWYRRFPGIELDEGSAKAWVSVWSGAASPEPMSAAGQPNGVVLRFPAPFVLAPADASPDELPAPAGASPSDVPATRLSDTHERVLALVLSGVDTHGAIVAAAGLSDRRVRDVLRDLVEAGHIRKIGRYGKYAPPEPGHIADAS
jgi:hypothetical protein